MWLSCFCAFKKWPAVFCDCISVWLGRIEHLHRPSSRAMIFLVFCSMEAFRSMLSCLTSHQSFFSSVMTAVRLFDCSTLNWPNSTWTQALHSEKIKVSQQHASVEWSAVMATSATDTPQTEVLAVLETNEVLVMMAAPVLSLPIGVLSLSLERLGVSAAMQAAWAENP